MENSLTTVLMRIGQCSGNESRLLTLGFLKLCERGLVGASLDTQIHVFMQVAYLLARRPGDLTIWSWLKEMSNQVDKPRQEAMRIAIFELVPELPVCEADLSLLWSFLDDPRTSWAVEQAYLHHPRLLREHRLKYPRHARK